jgi:hypothetical protein
VVTVIARKAEVVRPSGARPDVTEAQARTIRQLQDEEVCAGKVVETECGWIRIDDKERQVVATIDRSGTLLGLEGLGRRRKRDR